MLEIQFSTLEGSSRTKLVFLQGVLDLIIYRYFLFYFIFLPQNKYSVLTKVRYLFYNPHSADETSPDLFPASNETNWKATFSQPEGINKFSWVSVLAAFKGPEAFSVCAGVDVLRRFRLRSFIFLSWLLDRKIMPSETMKKKNGRRIPLIRCWRNCEFIWIEDIFKWNINDTWNVNHFKDKIHLIFSDISQSFN